MEKKVLDIVNTVLENRSRDTISLLRPEMKIREEIGFDSLDLAELTVRIEAAFDVDIFQEGIVATVGEIYQKIETK